jgi:hypothetical protein
MLRIVSPWFVAGIDLETDNCAPIIKYMRGWSRPQIEAYCKKRGWSWEYLP